MRTCVGLCARSCVFMCLCVHVCACVFMCVRVCVRACMCVLLVAGDLLSTGITRHNKNFTLIGDLHFQRPMPQVTMRTSLSDRDSAHTGDGASPQAQPRAPSLAPHFCHLSPSKALTKPSSPHLCRGRWTACVRRSVHSHFRCWDDQACG